MLNKRTLIGALATIIFVVAGPIAVAGPAFAGSTSVTDSNGITFDTVNGVATVTGYSGTSPDVVIPDTYSDGTVTHTVTSIGAAVFLGNKLTSVTFPANLTSIGDSAFQGNNGLGAVLFLGNAPTTITASGVFGTFGSTIPSVYYMAGSTGFEASPWNGYPVTQFVTPAVTSGLVVALATVNTAYSFQFTGSGSPAATFAVTPGTSLPAGLQLTSAGVLAGTPTGSGGLSTISVTTSNVFAHSTAIYPMTIQQGPVFTTDAPPVDLVAGTDYSYQFAATGYPAPSFTAVGVLPAGLALSTTGWLSGIPTTAGSYTIQVTATSGTLQPVSSSRHTVVVTAGAPTAIAVTSSAMQAARGDTITLSLTGTDGYGNPTGDLTSQAVFTSDWAADVITGSAVTFGHASTHIITARLGALVSTISIQVADPALAVTSKQGLAVTGVDAAPLSLGGTVLLILGLATLVTATRYRRRQATH